MKGISLQLYSVKDAAEKDYMGVLEKVAQMGYDGVEFAGFEEYSAEEIKFKLDELSIKASGSHVSINQLRNNIDNVIAFHKAIDCRYIIVPYAPVSSKADAVALNKEFAAYAKKLEASGLVFAYHNHDHEMISFGGEYALDIMLSAPEQIKYELDTFWTEYAGVDTAEYFKKLGNRCPLVHLKDMDSNRESTVYGEGILDNRKIVEAAKNFCSPDWLVIEWEAFGSCDCLEAVKKSIINLKSLL